MAGSSAQAGIYSRARARGAEVMQWLESRDGLSISQQALLFCVAMLLVFSRCPSQLLHAQFYAEDGLIWFQQAYNSTLLHSLTLPSAGYLQTLQRLFTLPSLLLPFRWAPLAMASMGLMLQCLPVAVLASRRCRAIGPLPLRMLFALLYVALGNTREIHVVLTNSMWHFAVVEILLAFSGPPRGWAERAFDLFVFAVGSLSGPFCLVLLPLVPVFWWFRRQSWSLVQLGVITAGSAVQLYLLAHSTRTHAPLGASVMGLVRIVGVNVVAGALLGGHAFLLHMPTIAGVLLALLGLAACGYCLVQARLELKLLVVYGGLLLAASLKSPLTTTAEPAWKLMIESSVSGRYWFFPMLALVWAVAWCAYSGGKPWIRTAGRWLVALALLGDLGNWRYAPYVDDDFPAEARQLEKAAPGQVVSLPVPPGWTMILVKRGS